MGSKTPAAPKDQKAGLLARLWSKLVEKPLWVMAALASASIGLLAALKFSGGIPSGSFRMEMAKALLQVIVVGVAGGLISLLLKEREKRLEGTETQRQENQAKLVRQEEERRVDVRYREELLKATLSRVTASYNNSKRARRNMKALALDRSKERALVNVAKYDEYMAGVNEAQLELETIKGDVETNQSSFRSAAGLAPCLKKMESYLNEIVSEYEGIRSSDPKATEISLRDLTWLSDFVGESEGSKFESEYASKHDDVRKAIRAELRELTSQPAAAATTPGQ